MKHIKLLLFWALILLNFNLSAQFSGSGSGTENDPYIITNGDELNQIRYFLNTSDVYFSIINDIDLGPWFEENNPTFGWTPIGNSSTNRFMGVLNGNDHIVRNFFIDRPSDDYIGFFGYTEGSTIKNICFTDGSVKGNNYVGLLIGYSIDATVTSNSSNVTISGTGSYVGGLIGYAYNPYSVSSNTINSDINSTNYVGGLIGKLHLYAKASTRICDIENNNANISLIGNNNLGALLVLL
jgi:hypothetical protein